VDAGTIGGGAIIRPEGIDISLLDPLWLAVVLVRDVERSCSGPG
jgi:hypothetical protein